MSGMVNNMPHDWLAPDGTWLASVVHHPRIHGYWLAMLCADLADSAKPSGWYRYKTWRGAVALVERKILPQPQK
jgi:hypothetical protein